MIELTFEQASMYALVGAIGAIAGAIARNRTLVFPSIYLRTRREDGVQERVLDVGFISTPLIGSFVAIAMDGDLVYAALWGLCVGYVGPSIVAQIVGAFLKQVSKFADTSTIAPVPVPDASKPDKPDADSTN